MSLYVESSITFDLTAAVTVIEHDKATPTHLGGLVHGNSIWSGVDFCIEEATGSWIWLEVKNWDQTHIPPARRGGSRWSFICKMKSREFLREMRGKFLGTTAYLALTGSLPSTSIQFALLFEPPTVVDSALIGSRMTRMRGLIPNLRRWTQPVHVSIMTLREWNIRFGHLYPAS